MVWLEMPSVVSVTRRNCSDRLPARAAIQTPGPPEPPASNGVGSPKSGRSWHVLAGWARQHSTGSPCSQPFLLVTLVLSRLAG